MNLQAIEPTRSVARDVSDARASRSAQGCCLKLRAKATTLEADVRAFKDKKVWDAAQRTSAIETVLALIAAAPAVIFRSAPIAIFFLVGGSRWESSRTPPTKARASLDPRGKQLTRRDPETRRAMSPPQGLRPLVLAP